MNWIEYVKQKPSPEPKRQVLVRCLISGPESELQKFMFETFSSEFVHNGGVGQATHWAEIEGPIPASFHEGMADIHSGRVTDMETAMNKPPPPDPFEEWWAATTTNVPEPYKRIGRECWDAAVKHMEATRVKELEKDIEEYKKVLLVHGVRFEAGDMRKE